MKKFKQFMLAALVVGFGYPVSAWAFNDLTNKQGQGQGQAQGQLQGQQQGQGQGQAQGQIGINKSKNINKNANLNANFNKNSNKNKATGIGLGLGIGKASNKGNTNNITIGGDEGDDYPASSAYAPGLVAIKCWGSTSLGGQGLTFGFSAGSTWKDDDCITLRNAAAIASKGTQKDMDAAHALECMISDVREAYKISGNPCPQDVAIAQAAQKNAAKYFRDPATGKIVRLETGAAMPANRVALVPLDSAPDNVIWNNDKHTVAMHTADVD